MPRTLTFEDTIKIFNHVEHYGRSDWSVESPTQLRCWGIIINTPIVNEDVFDILKKHPELYEILGLPELTTIPWEYRSL
jgi:hypothetical protein